MPLNVYEVEIEGTMPLLMHRFQGEMELVKKTNKANSEKKDPREIAEGHAHRDSGGHLFSPGIGFMMMMREMGSFYKQKSTRKSLKYIVPAGVIALTEVELFNPDTGLPQDDFEVDRRSTINQKVKSRVMTYRPRIEYWRGKIMLRIDTDILDEAEVRQLIIDGGQRNGIGSFRPQSGGPFGTFHLIGWRELDEDEKKLVRRSARL